MSSTTNARPSGRAPASSNVRVEPAQPAIGVIQTRRHDAGLPVEQVSATPALRKSFCAQDAAVAAAARTAVRRRIVAAVRQRVVEAERQAALDDLRLVHRHQRRMNVEPGALDAGLRRQVGHRLERAHVLGTAVGIARVVERVGADADVEDAKRFGPRERQREEHRVPGGHVGDRDARIDGPVLRHRDVGGQRRAADAGEIDRQLQVRADTKSRSHSLGGLELPHVPLPIAHAQRVEREALVSENRRGRVRIEAARKGARRLVVRSSLVGRAEARP